MWKLILGAIGVIVVLITSTLGGLVGKEVGKAVSAPSKPSQQRMDALLFEGFTKAAEQANARGPVMVDEDTRWDSTEAGPGARITYFYTFPSYSSREIDREHLLANLRPEVVELACASKEMKPSLEYGATYVYTYRGNDGEDILRFELNRRDCGY